MAHPEIQLDPERFHQRKSRELMKDGAWLVEESERPKGWERLGLEEPKAVAEIPVIKLQESAQPAETVEEPVPYEVIAKPRSPFFPIAEKAYELKDGEYMEVSAPEGADPGAYRNQLGAYMRTARGGVVQWMVRRSESAGNVVRLTRVGFWPDALAIRGKEDLERTVSGVSKSQRHVEETKTTTVERRTITETSEVRTKDEAKPKPRPLPNAVKELLVGSPSAEVVKAQPPQPPAKPKRPNPTTESVLDAVVKLWGPEDLGDVEHEAIFEELEDLGERLFAERHADIEAASFTNLIVENGVGVNDETWFVFHDIIHEMSTQKRLLELAVLDYCKRLYSDGDPYRCDRTARLLPTEDVERLEKVKAAAEAKKAKSAVP